MKILMLGWELPPHNSGGLGVACLQMSKALVQAGASIDFVVPYSAEHAEIGFMKVVSAVDMPPSLAYGIGAYDSARYASNMTDEGADGTDSSTEIKPQTLHAVQQQYTTFVKTHLEKKHEYEAIHVHDWLTMEAGMAAKALTNLPLIAHVHATEFDRSGASYGNPLVHEIEQAGLLMADKIIAVSDVTKQLIVQRYNIPAEKIEVMHNALSPEELDRYEYDQRTYHYLEQLKAYHYTIVATVTRFTVQKGLVHLLRAAARASERYDKLVFLFAGDGEQRDELLRLSAEFGIADKVFFTGFVRGKQWRGAYDVADIFVMSSVSEPFGITALEAAHFGNALVLTNQSGVGEVLKSVYRYDFWDIDALADRLITLAESPALRATMKANLQHEYRALDWHSVAQKCMLLYRQLQPERPSYV